MLHKPTLRIACVDLHDNPSNVLLSWCWNGLDASHLVLLSTCIAVCQWVIFFTHLVELPGWRSYFCITSQQIASQVLHHLIINNVSAFVEITGQTWQSDYLPVHITSDWSIGAPLILLGNKWAYKLFLKNCWTYLTHIHIMEISGNKLNLLNQLCIWHL